MPDIDTHYIPCSEALTLPGLFQQRVERTPGTAAYRQYDPASGEWRSFSWNETALQAARWQQALAAEGLSPGDRVAILYTNSVEWVCFDQAALSLQLVTVPLYTMDNAGNIAYILGDSGTRLLLLDSRARWEALLKYRDEFPELRHVICMGPVAEERATGDIRFTFVEQWLPQEGPESFRLQGFDAHNLASIVYTSGTTGRPKGVMLSHHNILWNAEAVMRAVPARAEDVFLSFLPLSHTFERTAGYYVPMMAGSCVAYARSIEGLRADLRTIRPTVLTSVPRIYEAAYSRIRQQLQRRGAIAQRLFHLAVVVGWRCFERAQGRGRPLDVLAAAVWPLFRRLVAQQILERLGGRLRVAISGGAPLPKEIAHTFVGLGLPLLQGYGLTEASPVVSGNRPESNVPESVGPPLPGVEIRLADQGELLVRSPGVMKGYWNRPEATRDAIDSDGWLHTGDVAELRDGFIYIRGRLKELIVTSTGEKVAPADVEMTLTQDPLFEQVMVVGEGRPFLAAVAVLAEEAWQELATELNLDPHDPASLESPQAKGAALNRMAELLHAFPVYAQPRVVHLTLEPWTIENGLITPTMKLKRPVLTDRFDEIIQKLYAKKVR